MLPETAREMAGKLGLSWRPDLLTSTTAEGSAYQERLGRAYFEEGLRKTGSVRNALQYYHGGPNPKMWGPKTRAYATNVLGRVGGS